MPNIASALKSEIARVARKEMRAEIEGLKRASVRHRQSVAELRRQVADLAGQLKQARKVAGTVSSAGADVGMNACETPPVVLDDGKPRRFSAARLAAHRAKLGLSATDYGKLVGMSGATIYNWEQGKARPKPDQVQVLGALKLLSPTAIRARLGSAE